MEGINIAIADMKSQVSANALRKLCTCVVDDGHSD